MEEKKKSWIKSLFAYANGEKEKLILSVILSVLSAILGLVPFYCMYEIICTFVVGTVSVIEIVKWCLITSSVYAAKMFAFSLSTGTSHSMA